MKSNTLPASAVQARNERADTVIAHTLRLAQEMRITAVAEGIETAEQLEFLRSLGCDYVQGYLIGLPAELDTLLNTQPSQESA